ncbi:MAG: TPR end-of-group domain-containing protein, partial [Longimicrobiales bacterium]
DYAQLAAAYLRLGDRAAAERAEQAALARAEAGDEPDDWQAYRSSIGFDTTGHFELAALEAQRGDVAATLERLEQAFEHGQTNMIWALMHPDFHAIRDDARFRRWIREKLTRGQEAG